MKVQIHKTAIVDDGSIIGEGTRIWHFAHVCKGAKIGRNVSLGQNVFIGGRATIGNNCKIQNNVSIYDNITLEDGVFCGPSMVFTNVYNPRALIDRKQEYKDTYVGYGATLGANSTILCGINIGSYAFVGAGAVVLKSIADFSLVVGNPASQIGWMSVYGERLNLPLEGNARTTCIHTGDIYELSGRIVFRVTK